MDNNPSIYAGGNATFLNHEGEGLVVVDGNATFDRPDSYAFAYQLGAGAGGGSGSWPARHALMLAVGGNLEVANGETLNVGLWDHKGTWFVGGEVHGQVQYAEDGDWPSKIPMRVDSLAGTTADGYRSRLNGFAETIGALAVTGTTAATQSDRLALEGDGVSPVQVFSLDYPALQEAFTSPVLHIDFTGIPEGASIVLNVVGADQVTITDAVRFTLNGVTIEMPQPPYTSWGDQDLAGWGALTQRLLWRFPTQSDILIGADGEGHEQFTGSIFAEAPGTSLRTHASTNGRVISFGDFTMYAGDENVADPTQSNLAEFHAFPFLFPGLGCSGTTDGTFAMEKVIEGLPEDYVFPAGATFNVEASWVDASGQPHTQTLEVPASGTRVYPAEGNATTADAQSALVLPADTVVTFKELGVSLPQGEALPDGYSVDSATFSPSSVVIGTTDGPTPTVTLTNVYIHGATESTGTFNLRKVLDGISAEDFPESTTFPVTATWGDQSAVFDLPADGSVVPAGLQLPEGTVVTFLEGELPPTPEGYQFVSQQMSARSITIRADDDTDIAWSITNSYKPTEPVAAEGGFSLNKALKGIDADKFPGDTFFEVTASWTIGGQQTSKSYQLPLDGSAVEGPQDLPEGTVVTFSEAKAPAVSGYQWEDVVFSPQSVTIADGQNLAVTATNTYSAGDLPKTGAAATMALLVGGLALVGAGLGAYFLVRRRNL